MRGSDISDLEFLVAMRMVIESKRYPWTALSELRPLFPGVPDKVLLSKARKMIKRGLVIGGDCGCRGDFEITVKGAGLLGED